MVGAEEVWGKERWCGEGVNVMRSFTAGGVCLVCCGATSLRAALIYFNERYQQVHRRDRTAKRKLNILMMGPNNIQQLGYGTDVITISNSFKNWFNNL